MFSSAIKNKTACFVLAILLHGDFAYSFGCKSEKQKIAALEAEISALKESFEQRVADRVKRAKTREKMLSEKQSELDRKSAELRRDITCFDEMIRDSDRSEEFIQLKEKLGAQKIKIIHISRSGLGRFENFQAKINERIQRERDAGHTLVNVSFYSFERPGYLRAALIFRY